MGKKEHSLNPADKWRKVQKKREKEKNKLKRIEVRERKKRGDDGTIPTADQIEAQLTMVAPKSLEALEREQLEKYPHPELSIYYHPVYNPLGAPPPGKPMVYKDSGFTLEGAPSNKIEALEYKKEEESEESEEETPTLNIPGLQDLPQIKPEPVQAEIPKEIPLENIQEEKKEIKKEIIEEVIDIANIPLPDGPPPPHSKPPIPRGKPKSPNDIQVAPVVTIPRPPIVPMHHMPPPIMGLPPRIPGAGPIPFMGPPMPMPMPPFGYPPPPPGYVRPPVHIPPPVQAPLPVQAPPKVAPIEPQAPPEEEGEVPMEDISEEDSSILVPTALRVKRNIGTQPKTKVPPAKKTKPFESADQAYDIFLKDMKNLGAL